MHSIQTIDNIKEMSGQNRSIVLTSSGMCNGGAVMQHFDKLKSKKNTFALTGYQSKDTNGHILLNLKNYTEIEKKSKSIPHFRKKIKLNEIKADIEVIKGYSGHADQKSLLEYLIVETDDYKYAPTNIFLNHGDNDSRNNLKRNIIKRSKELQSKYEGEFSYETNVIIPELDNQCYDLDENKWIDFDIKSEDHEAVGSNVGLVLQISQLTLAIKELTNEISLMKSKENKIERFQAVI